MHHASSLMRNPRWPRNAKLHAYVARYIPEKRRQQMHQQHPLPPAILPTTEKPTGKGPTKPNPASAPRPNQITENDLTRFATPVATRRRCEGCATWGSRRSRRGGRWCPTTGTRWRRSTPSSAAASPLARVVALTSPRPASPLRHGPRRVHDHEVSPSTSRRGGRGGAPR